MPWQVAQELFLIMIKKIDDGAGELNFANIFDEAYLNTNYSEARRLATQFYPKISSFFHICHSFAFLRLTEKFSIQLGS